MKKLLLLSFFSFMFVLGTNAQWGSCEPDLMYADSSFGVYPSPLTADNPDGGITTSACVGSQYFFVWTLKIPETIMTSLADISVDSIVVPTVGAVTGLPTGMTYAMNPENGLFTPEDSLACITIYGTPQVAGTYDLKIELTVYSPDLILFGGSQTFLLPDPIIPGAEGNYFLEVLDSGSTECFTDTDDILASAFGIRNLPNPFSGMTNIEITAKYADQLTFRVFDLIGNEIHQELIQVNQGLNNFDFDGSRLSNGIYMYTIEKDGGLVSDKMVIQN